jgi:hypothetical protein
MPGWSCECRVARGRVSLWSGGDWGCVECNDQRAGDACKGYFLSARSARLAFPIGRIKRWVGPDVETSHCGLDYEGRRRQPKRVTCAFLTAKRSVRTPPRPHSAPTNRTGRSSPGGDPEDRAGTARRGSDRIGRTSSRGDLLDSALYPDTRHCKHLCEASVSRIGAGGTGARFRAARRRSSAGTSRLIASARRCGSCARLARLRHLGGRRGRCHRGHSPLRRPPARAPHGHS